MAAESRFFALTPRWYHPANPLFHFDGG